MRRVPTTLAVLALALGGIAGCGDDDEPAGTSTTGSPVNTQTPATETDEQQTGPGEDLVFTADPGGQLRFLEDSTTARAGRVTVRLVNESQVPHDVDIERDGETVIDTEVVSDGESEASGELEAGSYTFFCSVPGHRAAGMEGELTVEG